MKEMPDLEKKHKQLGKINLENKKLDQALYHFEAAFEREPDYEVAQSLVSILLEQGDLAEAAYYLRLFEKEFRMDDLGFSLYLKLLIAEQNYLKIDCLWENQTIDIKQATESFYLAARHYYMTFSKELIHEKQELLANITQLEPMEQMRLSKEIKYLPSGYFLDTIRPLLKKEELAPFVRSDWFNWLVELKIVEQLEVCNLEGEIKSVVPVEFKPLKKVLQSNDLLAEMKEWLQTNQPSYYPSIIQMITLHIGLNYPFTTVFESEVTSWLPAYLSLFEIENSQKNLTNQSKLTEQKLKIKEFEAKIRQL